MNQLERVKQIGSIALELQSRMKTSEINAFLSGFGIECEDVSIVDSKRRYVEKLLKSVKTEAILDVANQLDVSQDSDDISVEAYFANIKTEISETIKNSQFSIWVAVAWFTDKELANQLREKKRSGINVQVIVNDDETTDKYAKNFIELKTDFK